MSREPLEAHKSANKEFYDSRSRERERFAREPSKVHTAELLIPWVLRDLPRGASILDIAGGAGTYASELARRADLSVVGLDISDAMIRERTRDPLLQNNVVADMERLPFANSSFDASMFVACLHHVPDPNASLKEAWRVLKPGARLFAFEPCSLRAGRTGSRPTHEAHEFRISLAWLIERVQGAGFRIERVRSRRLAMRLLGRVWPHSSLKAFHLGDIIDNVVFLVPGTDRLGSVGLLSAVKADLSP